MFTKILNLQNHGRVQTLPVFVSEVKMTITLLLQIINTGNYHLQSFPLLSIKVEGMAQNENPKTLLKSSGVSVNLAWISFFWDTDQRPVPLELMATKL